MYEVTDHVVAKPAMKKQVNTIIAAPALGVFCGLSRSRTELPTMRLVSRCLSFGWRDGLILTRSPDVEADGHPGTTDHQTGAATKVLDNVETRQGHTKVNGTKNDLGDVTVVETGGGENRVTVVEDEVCARELLQGLQSNTKKSTVEHTGASDNLVPGSNTSSALLLELILHVLHFLDDNAVVNLNTIELSHDLAGLVNTAKTVSVTGGLGQEKSSETQDQWPSETDAHGDSPRGSGLDRLGTVVDDIRDEDTKGDEKLEGRDHGTTDLAGCSFGLVHGDDAGEGADTETGNPTAHGNLDPVGVGGDLDNDTDDVDDRPEGHGEFAANAVGDGGGDEGSDHGSNAEKTDD